MPAKAYTLAAEKIVMTRGCYGFLDVFAIKKTFAAGTGSCIFCIDESLKRALKQVHAPSESSQFVRCLFCSYWVATVHAERLLGRILVYSLLMKVRRWRRLTGNV